MKLRFLSTIIMIFLFTSINFSQQNQEKVRIGTFDSRCIAIAYARSNEFMKGVDSIKIAYKKAKEEGNTQLAEKLEQIGQTRQFIAHQQVFSNASINNNILTKFSDVFPTIAEKNNLQIILSKWEITFADKSLELVDITDQLVDYFSPNEETRNIIEQIKTSDPVPIEELSE